jgi:nitrogen-specific signal transduction histidine kinase
VTLALKRLPGLWRIEVLDRGTGMNDAVLANALLPFYSTKRHGTGLGLALAREIAGSARRANRAAQSPGRRVVRGDDDSRLTLISS